jgi:hypothetical protein
MPISEARYGGAIAEARDSTTVAVRKPAKRRSCPPDSGT